MRIGIISDTHLRNSNRRLETIVERHFSDVNIIFHAGDIVELGVLDVFKGKEVYAVSGNMDLESVRRSFPQKLTLEIEGHRIGLIHGWGTPFDLETKLVKEFDNIECLVYGHTHQAANSVKDNILFFNPGSPMDRRFARSNTVGIIEINEKITGTIIGLDK